MSDVMDKVMDNNKGNFKGFLTILVRYQNLLLFLFSVIGYFLWRYIGFDFIVWDDTSSASFNIFANNSYYSLANQNFLIGTLKNLFGCIQGDGYRPFCAFLKIVGIAYFTDPGKSPVLFIMLDALVNGLLAVVYFHFALRFVKIRLIVLLAVFLLLFSTPVLSGALLTFSGNHCMVPLLICAGLLCYYKIIDRKGHTALWVILLSGIMLTGPLYREFVGILPLLILVLEFQRVGRRPTWLMGISVVFFLHALFPTALVKWVLFPDIPIRPVYAMGNLGAYLQAGTESNSILHIVRHLHWRIFIDIISIYPPTIFVLVLAAIAIKRRMYKDRPIFGANTVFLLIFFFLSFLPFLKIFNEQVHLTYCLVPASILLAKALEDLWFMMAKWRTVKIARPVFIALLIMMSADHALNAYAVRKVTGDIYDGIIKSADWFLQNVPKGTPVITNVHHLEDVRFYSGGHIEPWGAPGGIPDQRRWMHNPSDLQKLLDESKQRGLNIYFFDVEIKETPGQRGLGRNLFYVRDKNVEMEDLGILHTTQSRYPFLDPLKYLIPMGQITWVGPPDLEFDFYRGPALDGAPFHREVYARYHIYKATGDRVVEVSVPPQLVEENFHGFNLVSFRNRIYAIPQPEGAFELERVKSGDYSRSFEADSVSEVKQAISLVYEQDKAKTAGMTESPPQLVEENFHGFNLVSFRNRIYAIPQPEGAFELERVKSGDYSRSFEADSVGEVKEAIRQVYEPQQTRIEDGFEASSPELVEEGYRGFNIIYFRGHIYAILQIEGTFSLARFKRGDYNPSFDCAGVDEVKKAIDKTKSSVFTSFKIFCRQKVHGLQNCLK